VTPRGGFRRRRPQGSRQNPIMMMDGQYPMRTIPPIPWEATGHTSGCNNFDIY
jgi:hypothetical protein